MPTYVVQNSPRRNVIVSDLHHLLFFPVYPVLSRPPSSVQQGTSLNPGTYLHQLGPFCCCSHSTTVWQLSSTGRRLTTFTRHAESPFPSLRNLQYRLVAATSPPFDIRVRPVLMQANHVRIHTISLFHVAKTRHCSSERKLLAAIYQSSKFPQRRP